MRIGRTELLLVFGLGLAVAVGLTGQMSVLPTPAPASEGATGPGLLSGLALMAASLLLYVQSKRRELEVRAAAVAEEVRQLQERARELERLVAFWKALTQSLDIDAVGDTAAHHLPDIARSPDVWVVTGEGGTWKRMLGPAAVRTTRGERDITDLALGALGQAGSETTLDGIEYEGQACFPLVAAGATLGALGVPSSETSMTAARRQVVSAAAALVAVSVRSVNLLREVRENSLRDSLTGCVTRAHGLEVVTTELKRARRSRRPVSLLMIDVDHFKPVNDDYGHLCGDAVLAAVGARMLSAFRTSDLKCRLGGDEFLVLLPETSLEGAHHAAETVRKAISEVEVLWHGQAIRVTASVGVATALPNELDPTPLIAGADEALYRAKHEGRNCVRVAEITPVHASPRDLRLA
jgi:diguanylate cyclase (GGDEF)-like protein